MSVRFGSISAGSEASPRSPSALGFQHLPDRSGQPDGLDARSWNARPGNDMRASRRELAAQAIGEVGRSHAHRGSSPRLDLPRSVRAGGGNCSGSLLREPSPTCLRSDLRSAARVGSFSAYREPNGRRLPRVAGTHRPRPPSFPIGRCAQRLPVALPGGRRRPARHGGRCS